MFRNNFCMKRSIKFSSSLALAIAALSISFDGYSQVKSSAKTSERAKANTDAKSENTANARGKNKPKALPYNAMPAISYIDALMMAVEIEPRGEFESKEAFEARSSEVRNYPPGYVLIDRVFSQYFYDADVKTLLLSKSL